MNIITAVNDDIKYLSFVPSVAEMWKNITGKKLILGFVTNRNENDSLIKKFKDITELYIFKPIYNIPTGNQAKVTRLYLASIIEGENMIVDLDMYILNDYILEYTKKYKKDKLLTLGYNAYNNGKFPMCYTYGNNNIFKNIINSNNNEYNEYNKLLINWLNIKDNIDKKENINLPLYIFSDESLLRYLIIKTNNQKNIIKIKREDFIGMIATKRIDRVNFNYNKENLYNKYYIDCAPDRPLQRNKMEEIFKYLKITDKQL